MRCLRISGSIGRGVNESAAPGKERSERSITGFGDPRRYSYLEHYVVLVAAIPSNVLNVQVTHRSGMAPPPQPGGTERAVEAQIRPD